MSKVMFILSNSGLFMMPAHQIWSRHVTEKANSKNFSFCPNSTFNIRKSCKMSSRKALYFRSYQSKTSLRGGGGGIPPMPLGLRFTLLHIIKPKLGRYDLQVSDMCVIY